MLEPSQPTTDNTSTEAVAHWKRLSLNKQFSLIGAMVLLVGMIVIGFWVSDQIKSGVMRHTAASTALFVSSIIEPVLQDLSRSKTVSDETRQVLDELLNGTDLSRRLLSFKVWLPGGLVVYSSRHDLIGQRFPETPNLKRAWQGEVGAEFDTLDDEENVHERAAGIPLLEIYSPVRQNRTGHVIAVAEFYENAEALQANLFQSLLTSWLVVGGITALMFGALSGIVRRGSRTIDEQRHALQDQISNLSSLLVQNKQLSDRLQRASQRTAEINERYLRRISADLHDGPAQLMAFALLRLDSIKRRLTNIDDPADTHDIDTLRTSLEDALNEVRAICSGLTLPELETLTPAQLVRSAAEAHERRTGTDVAVSIETAPETIAQPYKICMYRFIQETLSNAFHHANGVGQRILLNCTDGQMELEVADSGPGFRDPGNRDDDRGLGLPGLRERIESLGGSMEIISAAARGSRIIMRCEVMPPPNANKETQ